MSVSVIPLPTVTTTLFSTITNVANSTITTTTTVVTTITNIPSNGVFVDTTGEIIIAIVGTILTIVAGIIYFKYNRVQKQKDHGDKLEQLLNKIEVQ